ncbi:MAG: fasciclin domain-containing protein [Acidobacteria bacterium]|nr:MAG: fasciclin domain-containing protein [Acidobacteriota bacterium]
MKNLSTTRGLTLLVAIALVSAPVLAGSYAKKDIVDTAVDAGSFNTLVAAVQAAGLVDALKADGPYTVFAPTDEAFAKLPAGTVENLLKPENIEQLRAVLTYHVVPGKIMAKDVKNLSEGTTLQGQDLSFEIRKGKVLVDGAEVIQADIATSNGVIHVIDAVVLPN